MRKRRRRFSEIETTNTGKYMVVAFLCYFAVTTAPSLLLRYYSYSRLYFGIRSRTCALVYFRKCTQHARMVSPSRQRAGIYIHKKQLPILLRKCHPRPETPTHTNPPNTNASCRSVFSVWHTNARTRGALLFIKFKRTGTCWFVCVCVYVCLRVRA